METAITHSSRASSSIARERRLGICWRRARIVGRLHRLDTAHLYRLALEKGSAGNHYHAVAEEGVPLRQIAGVIGRHLNVPVVSMSPEEAGNHFGWFAPFAAFDIPASSKWTQEQLGWQPKQTGLIPDLDRGSYFEAQTGVTPAVPA